MKHIPLALACVACLSIGCGGEDGGGGDMHAGGTGALASGGMASGGMASGGMASGGMASGGASTGGTDTGGSGGTVSGGTTAGGSTTGGAATGGTSTGGTKGTGGAMPTGAHCAPGETRDADLVYLTTIENCDQVGGGIDPSAPSARSIVLDAPIGPGDSYAFSVEMPSAIPEGRMELWGATSECGDGLELLSTHEWTGGIHCMEAAPETGTYTHLIWVWFGGGEHGDVTFCPGGSCGG